MTVLNDFCIESFDWVDNLITNPVQMKEDFAYSQMPIRDGDSPFKGRGPELSSNLKWSPNQSNSFKNQEAGRAQFARMCDLRTPLRKDELYMEAWKKQ
jgi:hypothetical protein